MACRLDGGSTQNITDIESKVKLNDDLLFNKLLSNKFWNCKFPFLKKPLTKWYLSSCQVKRIISTMIVEGNDASADERLPAGLTYVGQLVTHDIVSDSKSGGRVASPSLNLDSIFPDFDSAASHKLSQDELLDENGRLRLCERSDGYYDFKRITCNTTGLDKALIPDERNDENILVSQLSIILIRLQHRFVDELTNSSPELSRNRLKNYKSTRTAVSLIFQRIVVEEYLSTLLSDQVFQYYFKTRDSRFLFIDGNANFKVPLEFSHGVFRFGHTMIREKYVLRKRDGLKTADLEELFNQHRKLDRARHEVEWDLFFPPYDESDLYRRPLHDISNTPDHFNTASALGLNIASGLDSIGFQKSPQDDNEEGRLIESNPKAETDIKVPRSKSKLQNIVLEDLNASTVLPTVGDILVSMFGNSERLNQLHPALNISNFPDRGVYKKKTLFAGEERPLNRWKKIFIRRKGLLSYSCNENLTLDNSPLWLFVLREMEVFPEGYDRRLKLGPFSSLVIAEVIKGAINSSEKNIYNIGDQTFTGFDGLFQELWRKPSMYAVISQIVR